MARTRATAGKTLFDSKANAWHLPSEEDLKRRRTVARRVATQLAALRKEAATVLTRADQRVLEQAVAVLSRIGSAFDGASRLAKTATEDRTREREAKRLADMEALVKRERVRELNAAGLLAFAEDVLEFGRNSSGAPYPTSQLTDALERFRADPAPARDVLIQRLGEWLLDLDDAFHVRTRWDQWHSFRASRARAEPASRKT
jgi:hypothetical protein